MNWTEVLDRFEFHHHGVLHHQIEFVSTLQLNAFVRDRQMNLPLKAKPDLAQFITKTLFDTPIRATPVPNAGAPQSQLQ